MNKVFIGSLGTLGIITEVTFKLLPTPITRATVVGVMAEPAHAGAAVKRTLESFLLPEAIELLDPPGGTRHQCSARIGRMWRGMRSPSRWRGVQKPWSARFATSPGSSPKARPSRPDAPCGGFAASLGSHPGRLGSGPRSCWGACGGEGRRTYQPDDHILASAEALGRRHQWRGAVVAHAGSGVVRAGYLIGAKTPPELVRDELEALRREAEAAEGSLVVEAAPVAVKRHLDAWGKPGEAFSVMRDSRWNSIPEAS